MFPFKDYTTTWRDGVSKALKVKSESVIIGSNVSDYEVITPSDTVNLTKQAIAFIVTGSIGNITMIKPNGKTFTYPSGALMVGQIVQLPFIRINITGTTATGIVAVYST